MTHRLLHKPQLVFVFWKLDLKYNQTILQHIIFFISKPTLLLTLNIFIHRVLAEMLRINKMVLTTCYLLYNVYGKNSLVLGLIILALMKMGTLYHYVKIFAFDLNTNVPLTSKSVNSL